MSVWRRVVSAIDCSGGCCAFLRRKQTSATETLRAPPTVAAKNGPLVASPAEETVGNELLDPCFVEKQVRPTWQLAEPFCASVLMADVASGSPSMTPRSCEFGPWQLAEPICDAELAADVASCSPSMTRTRSGEFSPWQLAESMCEADLAADVASSSPSMIPGRFSEFGPHACAPEFEMFGPHECAPEFEMSTISGFGELGPKEATRGLRAMCLRRPDLATRSLEEMLPAAQFAEKEAPFDCEEERENVKMWENSTMSQRVAPPLPWKHRRPSQLCIVMKGNLHHGNTLMRELCHSCVR